MDLDWLSVKCGDYTEIVPCHPKAAPQAISTNIFYSKYAQNAIENKELQVDFVYERRGQAVYRRVHRLFAVDFDKLPEGYYNHTEFQAELKTRYPGAIVIPSRNNRTKMFLALDMKDTDRSKEQARAAVEVILCEEFHKYVDWQASEASFFSRPMWTAFQKQSKDIQWWSVKEIVDESCDRRRTERQTSIQGWDIMTELPTELKFVSGQKKQVALLIASMKGTEFQLPQKWLADQLEVSVSVVSEVIQFLVKSKLLVCTDAKYTVGYKAKSYKLLGVLADANREFHKNTKTAKKRLEDLPELVAGSTYNRMPAWSFYCLGRNMSLDEAVAFIYKHSKSDSLTEKEIRSRIKSSWNWAERRAA
jgi:hypothetical protein